MRLFASFTPVWLLALAACSEPASASPPGPPARAPLAEPLRAAAPSAGAPARDDGTCAAICATTRELGCGSEVACQTSCSEMRASTACTTEIATFLACAASRASSDWTCGDDAMPILRDTVCDKEQAVIAACLEKLAGKPAP